MSTLGAGRFYTANPYDEDAGGEGGLRADGSREPGARRRKLAGYLKAANELRQAYQSTYTNGWRGGDKGDWMDADDTPGAFPDATIVRSGEEEMVLFPSYARTHVKRKVSRSSFAGSWLTRAARAAAGHKWQRRRILETRI